MRVLVIGSGAIGSLLAARLASAHAEVILAARPEAATAIRSRGLHVTEADGSHLHTSVHPVEGIGAAAALGAFDLAIVAVKAYDTARVSQELAQNGVATAAVLTVQNGVGNEEILAAHLAVPVLAGALTTPVEVLAPGQIRVARATRQLAIAPGAGADLGHAGGAAQLLASAGFRAQVFSDYRGLKWTKLLMNILGNAQAAILDMTPAQIFAHPSLGNHEVLAWREALAVMRAGGIAPVALGGYPLPWAAPLLARLPLSVVRLALGRFIAGGRGGKMPSLYYDVHPSPRPRSELPWLNGAIVAAAARLHVPAPVNQALVALLTSILQGQETPTSWAGASARLQEHVQHWRHA